MKNADITNQLFRQAVEAIEEGNIVLLDKLITANKQLVRDRLDMPEPGYFQHSYLIYFVADNPIRVGKLPANILDITELLILFVKNEAPESTQQQLDYTLGLVATGLIPKECGVQIALMDVLIDAGAKPGGGLGALAHGNVEATRQLINRGGELTLAAAVGLDRLDDVKRMTTTASQAELFVALTMAAFYGKPGMITYLLGIGTNPNGYPENNEDFHSHATPLHQAVASGSLKTVKLLAEAGAKLDARDKIYHGTPLGWAMHMKADEKIDARKQKFREIADYLSAKQMP